MTMRKLIAAVLAVYCLSAAAGILVQGLPLRSPSPVDSAKIRRLLIERSGGITLIICRALARAGVAAIRDGQERIDLASLEDPVIWRGLRPAQASFSRLRPAALAREPE
jgi:hypothetical protein